MNTPVEQDDLLLRLRDFHSDYFPRNQRRCQDLVAHGQLPKTLFIGCSDSRLVPYLLTGAAPEGLFLVRKVGAFVPPYDASHGLHGTTTAAIEFAVLNLKVERIIACGHSHCGAIRTAYEGATPEAVALQVWLKTVDEALLPVQPGPEVLLRTEQRAVVLQLERLTEYPFVRRSAEAGLLSLHGWHCVIENGEGHVLTRRWVLSCHRRFLPTVALGLTSPARSVAVKRWRGFEPCADFTRVKKRKNTGAKSVKTARRSHPNRGT